ncbi:MAG: cysteine-rich CWC family protein [Gloeobacteraceae cyanobacterium ES-bin-316]|nr:cysteine-rich CWC family protein [Ferruginibacter sp.]
MNATRKIPAILSWSGGKDCAYALDKVLAENVYDVKYLLASFDGKLKKLSMHDVHESLIEEQARQAGIPLLKVYLQDTSNQTYESEMAKVLVQVKAVEIFHIIYGDIFLDDLRKYREDKMGTLQMKCVFPLWKTDTQWLINDLLNKGFKSITCCVNDVYLPRQWIGREIDQQFVSELPAKIDACGENGEYHSFCYAGPIFKNNLAIEKGLISSKFLEVKMHAAHSKEERLTAPCFWFIDIKFAVANQKHELKTCPRCKQSFECKVGDVINCQCYAIAVPWQVYDHISQKYDECICAECLQELNQPQQLFKEKFGKSPH